MNGKVLYLFFFFFFYIMYQILRPINFDGESTLPHGGFPSAPKGKSRSATMNIQVAQHL